MTKSRRIGWVGHVEHMGEKRNSYNISVKTPEGKRSLEKHMRRWENNILKWILMK
jgi:hypothetical protein